MFANTFVYCTQLAWITATLIAPAGPSLEQDAFATSAQHATQLLPCSLLSQKTGACWGQARSQGSHARQGEEGSCHSYAGCHSQWQLQSVMWGHGQLLSQSHLVSEARGRYLLLGPAHLEQDQRPWLHQQDNSSHCCHILWEALNEPLPTPADEVAAQARASSEWWLY